MVSRARRYATRTGWEPRAEQQAHAFAAEFLMPADQVESELRAEKLTWRRLLNLKLRWGVSMQALLFRAKALRVLGDQQYVNWLKGISARGWRVDEPGDAEPGAPERSTMLERAVAHLEAEGVTLPDLARRAGLPSEELRVIVQASVDSRPHLQF